MKHNILKLAALALASLSLAVGCTDELSTDQLDSSRLNFSAFAPNPVYRGGELTIIGTRLGEVSAVEIPGVEPITEFTVTEDASMDKLVLVVPVDGPEVGKISIVGKDGTRLTSSVDLTYTEPIVFTSFEPASAMPGDVVTIKGDYLNLVAEVIFPDGQYVTEFESQSRYELTVVVPEHAVSGRLIIGDSNEVLDPDNVANKVYSDAELTIGDPTVSSLAAASCKPGKSAKISGKYLCMIEKLTFEGGTVLTEFNVSEDWKSLEFEIPATAKSGDVVAHSYAGKEFKAGSLEMVLPTGLSVAEEIVKAGSELTIKGSDLDIVTKLTFPGAGDAEFAYVDGAITVTVPATATEGEITLTMDNGDTATVEYALVHAAVESVPYAELKAGEYITITGTDLDLVASVTLGGKAEEFELVDKTTLLIATSATSVSGKIVLTQTNGETIEPETEITLSYDSLIIVNEMPASEHIGATVTLKGERFMLVENIFIGDAKVTQYTLRNDNEVSFVMPYNSVGTYSIKFALYDGSEEICPQQIEVLLEIQYITAWEGNLEITWGDGGRVLVPAVKFNDVKPGAKMRLYYSQKADTWAQAQFDYGDWSTINFDGEADGAVKFDGALVPTDVYGWTFDTRVTEVVLTKTILENIQAKKAAVGDMADCGLLIMGSDLTFTKVEILQEIPQETTIWEGSEYSGADYNNNLLIGGEDDWVNAGLYDGAEVRVYFTAESATEWQVQLFDGHWGAMNTLFPDTEKKNQFNAENSPNAISDGYVSFIATGTVLESLTTHLYWGNALIVQGKGITVTKLTFK